MEKFREAKIEYMKRLDKLLGEKLSHWDYQNAMGHIQGLMECCKEEGRNDANTRQ